MTDNCDVADYDVVLLDHADLDEFMAAHRDEPELFQSIDIFTDDEYTRNKVEFNLIVGDRDEYGIGTQLHNPFTPDDAILDLRDTDADFSDWAMGLV